MKSIRPHGVDEFAGAVPLAAFFVCSRGVGVSQFFGGRVFGVWHGIFGLGPVRTSRTDLGLALPRLATAVLAYDSQ